MIPRILRGLVVTSAVTCGTISALIISAIARSGFTLGEWPDDPCDVCGGAGGDCWLCLGSGVAE